MKTVVWDPIQLRHVDGITGKPVRGGAQKEVVQEVMRLTDVWLGPPEYPRDQFLRVLNMPGAKE